MDDLAQLLCVVVSLTGGVYCVSLLRNSRKRRESAREAVRSLPRSARRKSVCARINRLCQVMLASTFLAVAASLLTILAYRALPLLWEEPPVDQQMRHSVETVLIQGCPPVLVDYDTSQPSRPVVGIDCFKKPISDDQVRCLLRQAPKLVWLNLGYTDITDEALCELGRVPKLHGLCLDGTRIGDLRLNHLAELKCLESLSLQDTNITDRGLRCLADLKNLQELFVRETAVTDTGLEWLGSLEKLEVLDLSGTRVTEEGIHRLESALPRVSINFRRPNVTAERPAAPGP
ncbi:MAG: leucine-rich repeat domain-containing protein [Thermoguttaceae bacterium]|jgi:hypothetical protein